MATKLVQVTFGSQSTDAMEYDVDQIYSSMVDDDRSVLDFARNNDVNAAIVARVGRLITFYGPQAMKFLQSYGEVSMTVADSDYRGSGRQMLPEPEDFSVTNRLSKTRFAPGADVAQWGPTTGHHYRYVPPRFLPEENMGLYSHNQPYALTSRFPRGSRRMHPDGRTRLPSNP